MLSLLFFIIVLLIILRFIQFCIKNGSIIVNTGIKVVIFLLRLAIILLILYGLWKLGSSIAQIYM